jgi:lysine 2,3-aminomutase
MLRGRIRTVAALHRRLARRGVAVPAVVEPRVRFGVCITPYYADLIRKADFSDPVYRMCVPAPEELRPEAGLAADPFGEMGARGPLPGVIRRYRDRAVVLATRDCAVHCRHCTRRAMLAAGSREGVADARRVASWLAGEPAVREVILSGGDPLTLSDARLERLLRTIRSVPRVEQIRIGTRVPVVLPQRITPGLVRRLRRFHPLWLNTHFNHPAELTPEAARACARLVDAGIPVGNQAVLLRGINDDAETLESLFRGLLRMRVRPYYLLQCDPVEGAGHFRVPIRRGRALMKVLRARMTGLGIPVYAADIPGAASKQPL